jgi:AmmeMemoRadiSam system protein B/AmmeMemoRadiSam system protein A
MGAYIDAMDRSPGATHVRPPAVAGFFYPADPGQLTRAVDGYLADAPDGGGDDAPKAIIVPHAGYIYSAPVAAPAYAALRAAAGRISRVVMLGPAHRVTVRGLAAPTASAFRTPLGAVPIDRAAVEAIAALPQVALRDDAHRDEHCLEVQLPFLQRILGDFTLVPLVVGDASPAAVAEVLERLWGGPETLIVVSSDLSHYHDYATAQRMDRRAAEAIESFDPGGLDHEQACGRLPILGLLTAARRHGLGVARLDLRNSGDTAGPRDRVVGYGAWKFSERGPEDAATDDGAAHPVRPHARRLLRTAAAALRCALRHGRIPKINLARFPAALAEPAATFVTLRHGTRLRGCIGTAEALRPIAEDVVANTFGAAFRDPRFDPLTASELRGLSISVSILSPRCPLAFKDEADLLTRLRPGIDGLLIRNGTQRGLFLPQVWESLPAASDFLLHLKDKAGIERPLQPQSDRAEIFSAYSAGTVTMYADDGISGLHRYN